MWSSAVANSYYIVFYTGAGGLQDTYLLPAPPAGWGWKDLSRSVRGVECSHAVHSFHTHVLAQAEAAIFFSSRSE